MKCSKGFWIFLLLVLLCLLAIPIHTGIFRVHIPKHFAEQLFKNFTQKYNKSYLHPEEFQKRFNIFTITLEKILHLNAAHNSTAHFDITKYSDLSPDEFAKLRLSPSVSHIVGARLQSIKGKPPKNTTTAVKVKDIHYTFTDDNELERFPSFYKPQLLDRNLNFVPMKVDWRQEKILHPVRAQGPCGVCWAYSVAGMIEANLAIHHNLTETISIQQMVDCARNGNEGCAGGDSCLLLEWLKENHVNIRTETEYPLAKSGLNETCKISANDTATGLKVYRTADFACNSFIGNESIMLEIIANYGPIAVAVNAMPWQHFDSGIIQNNCDGSADNLNHAALIVGFDRSGPVPHYIVENSWGSDFGEKGFVRISYGNNTCGIASQIALVKL